MKLNKDNGYLGNVIKFIKVLLNRNFREMNFIKYGIFYNDIINLLRRWRIFMCLGF